MNIFPIRPRTRCDVLYRLSCSTWHWGSWLIQNKREEERRDKRKNVQIRKEEIISFLFAADEVHYAENSRHSSKNSWNYEV